MATFRLRSTPHFFENSITQRIDKDNAIIYGVTAMQSGVEAIGHGVMADSKTLEVMVNLGNAQPNGVRSRFGHPGMSENAAGKKVAMARNFRVDGDKLVHDSYMLSSARKSPVFSQDPIEFLLDVAENAPQEMGESVVIMADAVWTLDDGREIDPNERVEGVKYDEHHRPLNATTPLPVLRPQTFAYVDFVNEGALTHDGLFSASIADTIFAGTSSEYLHDLFQLVDNWRAQYDIPLDAIPNKIDRILHSYIVARGGTEQGDRLMAKRRRKLEADDPVVEIDEVVVVDEPVAEESELSTGQADEALDAAEAQLSALTEELTEPEESPVTRSEFDAWRTRVAEFAAQLEKLGAKYDRLASLLTRNLEATQAIHRNQQRLSGEPVVTQPVSRNRVDALDPIDYIHPQPTQFALDSHQRVTHRKLTPEQELLERQEARRRNATIR